MSAVTVPSSRLRLSSGAVESLKWLALLAMLVDHVNAVFFARELGTWATAIGRIAMPLFALVLGYNIGRPGADLARCLRRLLLFGLLALPFHAFLFAQVGGWWPLNIMFTFAVAVGSILLAERGQGIAAAAVFVLGSMLVEYWWPGVALVLIGWAYRVRPSWLGVSSVLGALVLVCAFVNGNAWALLSLPLIAAVAWWSPQVPRAGRFFWWFYPAHLAAIAAVSVVMM